MKFSDASQILERDLSLVSVFSPGVSISHFKKRGGAFLFVPVSGEREKERERERTRKVGHLIPNFGGLDRSFKKPFQQNVLLPQREKNMKNVLQVYMHLTIYNINKKGLFPE